MRRACTVLLLILGFTAVGFAGKVYGSLTDGGKAVSQNVKVEITCGNNSYSAQTDAYGSFKLYVPDKGKCMLKAYYQGQTPSFGINSYEGPVQYDLILEKQGTQYTLRRK